MNFAIFKQLFIFNLTKKTPCKNRAFIKFKKHEINYALASAAIKFNAEPATNQPI